MFFAFESKPTEFKGYVPFLISISSEFIFRLIQERFWAHWANLYVKCLIGSATKDNGGFPQ